MRIHALEPADHPVTGNSAMHQRLRLAGPEGDGRHPYVNERGAFVGPGVALVEAEPDAIGRAHFRPRPVAQLDALLAKAYGVQIDCARLEGHLRAVARALNDGDLARAAIALLHARLPPLPDDAAAERLAKADNALRAWLVEWREVRVGVAKTNYNPDEPRVPKGQPGAGQWTADGASAHVGEIRVANRDGVGSSAPSSPSQQPEPTERGLTPGEIALAHSVFGDRIDYSQVKIFRKRAYPIQPNDETMAPDGNIYFAPESKAYLDDFAEGDPLSQGHFIHEMTHVYQVKHGVDVVPRRIAEFFVGPGYDYHLTPGKTFDEYGIEQQATIVEDYFGLKNFGIRPRHALDEPKPSLEDYRKVLPF